MELTDLGGENTDRTKKGLYSKRLIKFLAYKVGKITVVSAENNHELWKINLLNWMFPFLACINELWRPNRIAKIYSKDNLSAVTIFHTEQQKYHSH